MLAWGGWRDPTVHLIELATGKERHGFVGPSGRVLTLSFAPDGKRLVAGYDDTTAVVWDLTGRLREPSAWGQPLTAAGLNDVWTALAGDDAPAAFRMVQKLAGSPKGALPVLRERLQPVPVPDAKHVARLITDLDSTVFLTRERAAKELDRFGEAVLGPCEAALAGKPSLEVRRRLETLKAKYAEPWRSPERLRILRALEALELCGTTEARALLTVLANGARGASLTHHAQAALKRLSQVP
jgi:hypothetical protein